MSVMHRRTHNLHGNSLIFLSVAVRPAAHMVTEWTGCADDQRWGGESWGGEECACIRDGGCCLLSLCLSLSLFHPPPPSHLSLNSAICRPQELL